MKDGSQKNLLSGKWCIMPVLKNYNGFGHWTNVYEPWIVHNSFMKEYEWDKRKHLKSKNKAKVKLIFFSTVINKVFINSYGLATKAHKYF